MILQPASRGTPTDSSAGAWLVASLAAIVLAADAVTWMRVKAFEADPPPPMRAEARAWYQAAHRRGSTLRVETSNGWIDLTRGPSSVLGSTSSGVDSKRLVQNGMTSVAWIDAPASPLHGTVHYPLHVEQAGRVLLHIDGAAAVAEAERADLLPEAEVAVAVFVIAVTSGVLSQRRARRRRTALAEAARARRA